MNIEKRIKRNLKLFDLFFVPSSLIRAKINKEINLGYIPITIIETARGLIESYYILSNYVK